MEFVRGRHNLAPRHRGSVVTVGNYDGVHLGHRAIIDRVREQAAALECTATVVSFEPTYREFTDPAMAPARLTRWREKYLALAQAGVDRFVSLKFDHRMCDQAPEAFVREILVHGLGAKFVIVGHDFRFGRANYGDIDSLRAMGVAHGFGVSTLDAVSCDGVRASSTVIRERLASGDFVGAERLLGRPYMMLGRVTHGRKLGRTLGFPTVNLPVKRVRAALGGVFAVRVMGIGAEPRAGVASLGTRPTVNGVEPLLEAHVFDYAGDLYGRLLSIEFVKKLRDETKFTSVDEMTAQMHFDAAQARAVLL
jgi:riboflavin kinase / FMN adenylyltransferase